MTDEELAAILRPSEGAAIEMLTGEMMGVRDPEGDGDHFDAYQEIAAPLVRRERALAAEVTAPRADLARVAGGTPDQQIEAWRAEAHEQEDAAEDAQEELEEAEEQIAEASAALTALGHPDDGKTLAERIADAHAGTMAHLRAARAEVAALRAQIEAAEKLAADRLHVLRRLEWSGTGDAEEGGTVPACPWCGAEERDAAHPGDCELAVAIGARLLNEVSAPC